MDVGSGGARPNPSALDLRSLNTNLDLLPWLGFSPKAPGRKSFLEGVLTRRGSTVHRPGCSSQVFLWFSTNSSPLLFLVPGLEKLEVELRNSLPSNILPDTPVVRELSINGESNRMLANSILVTAGLLLG